MNSHNRRPTPSIETMQRKPSTKRLQFNFYAPHEDRRCAHTKIVQDHFEEYRIRLHCEQSKGRTFIEWGEPMQCFKRNLKSVGRRNNGRRFVENDGKNTSGNDSDFEVIDGTDSARVYADEENSENRGITTRSLRGLKRKVYAENKENGENSADDDVTVDVNEKDDEVSFKSGNQSSDVSLKRFKNLHYASKLVDASDCGSCDATEGMVPGISNCIAQGANRDNCRQICSSSNSVIIKCSGINEQRVASGETRKCIFKNADIASKRDELREKKDEIVEKKDEGAEKKDKIAENEDAFTEKKDEIVEKKDDGAEKKDKTAENEDEFVERKDEIVEKDENHEIVEKKDEMMEKNDECDDNELFSENDGFNLDMSPTKEFPALFNSLSSSLSSSQSQKTNEKLDKYDKRHDGRNIDENSSFTRSTRRSALESTDALTSARGHVQDNIVEITEIAEGDNDVTDEHVSMDTACIVVDDDQSDDGLAGPSEDDAAVPCPMCGAMFRVGEIEVHAATCYGNDEEELPDLEEVIPMNCEEEGPELRNRNIADRNTPGRRSDDVSPPVAETAATETCILCRGRFDAGEEYERHFNKCFAAHTQNRELRSTPLTNATRDGEQRKDVICDGETHDVIRTYSKKKPLNNLVRNRLSKRRTLFDLSSDTSTDEETTDADGRGRISGAATDADKASSSRKL